MVGSHLLPHHDHLFWDYLLVLLLFIIIPLAKAEDFKTLSEEFYQWHLKTSPEWSTETGEHRYNDLLESYNTSIFDERKGAVDDFLRRAKSLDASAMKENEKLNYDVFVNTLKAKSAGYKWRWYGASTPVNFLEGIPMDFDRLIEKTPFTNVEDYNNYLSRLTKLPHQINEQIVLMQEAITRRLTNHAVSMAQVPHQIETRINKSTTDTKYYEPFRTILDNLTSISQTSKTALKNQAEVIIREAVIPAFRNLTEFISKEYIPNGRKRYGVSSLPNGAEYYKACLAWHLSQEADPDQVHQTGLDEVKRISELMQKVLLRENFNGTTQEFSTKLKNDPSLHLGTKEKLLNGYKDIVFNRVKPKLSILFKDYPNLPVVIKELPFNGPGGMFDMGSEDGIRPGIFYANVNNPQNRTTFEMVALSLHEVDPGHHLQRSYRIKADLLNFRKHVEHSKYQRVPYHFPFQTAYSEGWALYAEFLGEEMDVYNTSRFELYGRYSSEIFRACRLVVDTGIHTKGWSREQAIQFMLNYTAKQRDAVEVEIDRYITWPGQACAYKVGQMKIQNLRKLATDKLGSNFDIKEFHSVVLTAGELPMNYLEKVVNNWISETLKPTASAAASSNIKNVRLTLYAFMLLTIAMTFKS